MSATLPAPSAVSWTLGIFAKSAASAASCSGSSDATLCSATRPAAMRSACSAVCCCRCLPVCHAVCARARRADGWKEPSASKRAERRKRALCCAQMLRGAASSAGSQGP